MGVVCILPYPVPEGKSGQQVVDMLQQQVEMLGAIKGGYFAVDCETYSSVVPNLPQRNIYLLHNTEQPASCFAILDTGTSLIADSLFADLMHKIKTLYQQRKGAKIESRGQRYEYKDFIIKIGSVSMGPNFRGILFEVEYCPCVIPVDCWTLMKEFLQGIVGNLAENPPAYLKQHSDKEYTPLDTINQYLEHFNNFRKTAPQPQQNRVM